MLSFYARRHPLFFADLAIFTAACQCESPNEVISGNITPNIADTTLTITQTSDKAIIHRTDFSIASGETTDFVMPSASSAVLNRVTGGNMSNILGTLNANGQIYLINPNGIVVGADGVINTQSFIASTLDVTDADFLAGGDLTFSGSSTATVINMGTMSAVGGDVFLIANRVENQGSINANEGVVGMAAGQEVLLASSNDQRLAVQLGNDHEEDGSKVINTDTGTIQAIQAELKSFGGNPYALAVNNAGLIQASGTETREGRIYLSAQNDTINVSGTLISKTDSDHGGDVLISGERIELTSTSVIDASGITENNAGSVKVYGQSSLQYQGEVDTGGGTLVLGLNDIVISDGSGADSTIDIDALERGLKNNHVVVEATEGDISVEDDVNYWRTNSLTFVAKHSIFFDASVQNHDEDGGDLNIVAGWDGVEFDRESINDYGQNNGDVLIGDGDQTDDISVGSRNGMTRVYANELRLTGSYWESDHAHLGYLLEEYYESFSASGDIEVAVQNSVELQADKGMTQIGHSIGDHWEDKGISGEIAM